MELNLKTKILDSLKNERNQSIINTNEFYFQKAKDELQRFLDLEIKEETKEFLIANKRQYSELKQLFDDSEDLFEFGRSILSLISYCDSNAYKKSELNLYVDKRVLALAFVRMNYWIEHLITYKFEGILTDGSIKNAIEYLLKPEINFTMLSENHRNQIAENLFKKKYNISTFKDDFINFFSECSIKVKNPLNYTYLLSRISYEISSEWKESIIGLVCPDSTGWQLKAIDDSKNGSHIALWNHKKPNGTNDTLKLLRQCIEENGFFRIFYTSSFNVNYIAEIIDFVTSQQELDKSKWIDNYGNIEWYSKDFKEYIDGSKTANWVYLASKIYPVNPDEYLDFKYHKSYGYPSVGCQAPVVSYKNMIEIKKQKQMEINISLLEYKKQIILQGPPGTGKTKTAKDIAVEMLQLEDIKDLKDNEQFKLVQFHPSYTYEDFVRGILVKSNGNQIEYITENRVLAKFAKTAQLNFEEFLNSKKSLTLEEWTINIAKDYLGYIKDEIKNKRANYYLNSSPAYISEIKKDSFIYNNDDWSGSGFELTFEEFYKCCMDDRLKVQIKSTETSLSKIAHIGKMGVHLLADFWAFQDNQPPFTVILKKELKKYILIIDEINRANLPSVLGELIYALEYRGEKVESMYDIKGDNSLIIPPNLFIIGTMNTADRSVGHIDYAIKRRFAFVNVLPTDQAIDDVITDAALNKKAKDLYNKVADLFNEDITKTVYLQSDFKAKDVQLGHSYFLAETEKQLELKLEYEIKPLLNEYVKDGILSEEAIKEIESLKI